MKLKDFNLLQPEDHTGPILMYDGHRYWVEENYTFTLYLFKQRQPTHWAYIKDLLKTRKTLKCS